MIWRPINEGKDHINVYSKSALPLGRALSNFFQSTFVHPEHGVFKSMEGYYFWLLTGQIHDGLKDLHGFPAKSFGGSQKKVRKIDKSFKEEIQIAITHKIIQNEYIQGLLIESKLPLAHYYYYGDKEKDPVIYDRSKQDGYMLDAIEEIRIELKKNGRIYKGYH